MRRASAKRVLKSLSALCSRFSTVIGVALLVCWVSVGSSAEKQSSRWTYDLARRALLLPEARSTEEVNKRLTRVGLVQSTGGWTFADSDGQVLVTAEFGLRTFVVGFSPAAEKSLSGEVLGSLSRAAKTVTFSGPDELHYAFDGVSLGPMAKGKLEVTEELVISVADGRWIETRTLIQFGP